MKNKIIEGDVYEIPLDSGGISVGVAARVPKRSNAILSYFFDLRTYEHRRERYIDNIKPENAILILRHSNMDLKNGSWPIVGRIKPWNREEWPIPIFIRRPLMLNHSLKIRYEDNDLYTESEAIKCDRNADGPDDALFGSRAVSLLLSHKLS